MHPRRIREAESVADHSYSLAIQALLAAHALALDPLAMVEMALIHDLPEYKTGDQVTAGLKGPALEAALAKKRLSEEKAMRTIRKRFGVYGNDLYERWLEYNERLTPESRVLAELDKLEAAFQAVAVCEAAPRRTSSTRGSSQAPPQSHLQSRYPDPEPRANTPCEARQEDRGLKSSTKKRRWCSPCAFF
jgi:5'-deoxynucleotidase YfbR-like HD superfamily hydrolase